MFKEKTRRYTQKEREYGKKYRAAHKEYYAEYMKQYNLARKKYLAKYHKEYWSEYREKHLTELKQKRKLSYVSHKRPDSEIPSKQQSYSMWCRAKKRAKYKHLDFTITPWDIKIPDICPYLEIPLNKTGAKENMPSLDRIDNSKGYTKDNIRVISYKANTMKNNATKERLLLFAKNIIRLHSVK